MAETGVSRCSEVESQDEVEYVKVVVRCCCMKDRELARGQTRIVEIEPVLGDVTVTNSILLGSKPLSKKTFSFDAVYDWVLTKQDDQSFHDIYNSKQRDFYDGSIKNIVDSVLQGIDGTVFAYGQTGAGKTTTIHGLGSEYELRGVIPRSCEQIFDHISQSRDKLYLVHVSYIQIYQEQITDLLSPDCFQSKYLEIKEHPEAGVFLKNLTSVAVKDMTEVMHLLQVGNLNRDRWITHMSMQSSRIHYIFTVAVECCEVDAHGEKHVRVGRLNLVDMAGSERQSKTEPSGERLKEAAKISMSLSPFGNVISALVDDKSKFVPYRNSKLTRLLKDSLGGTARTVMVACISPASCNYEETISTLRYADRAKKVKNRPRVHVDPQYALLLKYQDEIDRLKSELQGLCSDRTTEGATNQGVDNKPNLSAEEIVTDTSRDDERDTLVENLENLGTEDGPNSNKHAKCDRDSLAAKIQGMESRLLNGKTCSELAEERKGEAEIVKEDRCADRTVKEDQTSCLEMGKLLEVIVSDVSYQRIFIYHADWVMLLALVLHVDRISIIYLLFVCVIRTNDLIKMMIFVKFLCKNNLSYCQQRNKQMASLAVQGCGEDSSSVGKASASGSGGPGFASHKRPCCVLEQDTFTPQSTG